MKLKTLVVGPLDVNCSILWDKKTKDALCIDPGGDADEILSFIHTEGLSLRSIINTHGHFDHIGGNAALKKQTGAQLAIHAEDALLLERVATQGAALGMDIVPSPKPDLLLKDGDRVMVGEAALKVIHTPGHTKGGVCLYVRDFNFLQGVLFTGDTLFAGSIGRTDLPGGSYSQLITSIKKKILPLGDNIRVIPGHGPETTIGEEKLHNQFLIE